jgi:hypothetical protein
MRIILISLLIATAVSAQHDAGWATLSDGSQTFANITTIPGDTAYILDFGPNYNCEGTLFWTSATTTVRWLEIDLIRQGPVDSWVLPGSIVKIKCPPYGTNFMFYLYARWECRDEDGTILASGQTYASWFVSCP